MIKLYHSPSSPFVRKVLVTAHETGQADRIEIVKCAAHPIDRDRDIVAQNPLGQVPTAVLKDGTVLYDSRVICEYLDWQSTGPKLFPTDPAERWPVLAQQALGDGLLGAALMRRYENAFRPAEFHWDAWDKGQQEKVISCLEAIEAKVSDYGDKIDIGAVTIACGLSYLDFRLPDFDWRSYYPATASWFERFSERPSMQATGLR